MSLYQSIVFIARNVEKHFFSSFSRFQILFRGYATLFPANNIPGDQENSRPTQVSRPLGGRPHESVFLPKFTRTQNSYCLTRLDRMGFPPPRKASTIMHFFQDDRTVMCSPKDGIPVSSFHIMICFLERRKGN
ncbi:CDA_G0008880.mRNA.1.CDS.1 [Saccharomyces cerevisiae]|nr:CDA_G0008880.mRNA.1.CDS.1 [Saccharomyces cerevisiae]CAI7193928.1 CDA_G0008880.mRNA.1.CDS.1 [Saccharomyces cerevisiae]